LFNQTMLMLTGFSTAPLRLASLIGFCFTIFGILILLYVLFTYFAAGTLQGFAFLASIIALFGGAQLFAIGIIGEYLARIFNRSLERPTYIVQDTTYRNSDTFRELLPNEHTRLPS
jgi:chromate transport protein ChrA